MQRGLQICQCDAFKGCHWKEPFWSLTLHALASERWSGLSSSLFIHLSSFLSLFLVQLVYPYLVTQETNERFCVSQTRALIFLTERSTPWTPRGVCHPTSPWRMLKSSSQSSSTCPSFWSTEKVALFYYWFSWPLLLASNLSLFQIPFYFFLEFVLMVKLHFGKI